MNISPLERFLTTSDPTSPLDEPTLDLENICALRTRSMRKFVRALESIVTRYEGDGDEESDDVVDLDRLEVIEDRGYILKRLSHHSHPSPNSIKGKNKADPRLEIFELLDPVSGDEDPDGWVGHHDKDDEEDQGGDTDEEDSENEDSDLSIISIPSSPSSSSSSSSPSSSKNFRTKDLSPKRKKLDHLLTTSASSTNQSALDSLPDQTTPPISYLDPHNTVTNELFERLKKRVQERSSDITRHKLHKDSMTRHLGRPGREPSLFSSPSSSLITTTSLSSVLTTIEPILSPYLQRLLHPSGSHAKKDHRTRALLSLPQTPSTLRRNSPAPTSAASLTLDGPSQQTRSISSRKRPRPSSPIFSSSPRTVSRSIRPALLFPSPISTALKPKTFKPQSPSRSTSSTNFQLWQHQDQDDEDDRHARESSEDPMLLPPSSKKSKSSKSKPTIQSSASPRPDEQG